MRNNNETVQTVIKEDNIKPKSISKDNINLNISI